LLDLRLSNPHRLRQAFSYPTMHRRSDHPDVLENERLEYLGDSVIGLATSTYLYDRYPDLPEGDLTSLRAALVCAPTLSAWARRLRLDQFLDLEPSSAAVPGGRNLERLLASIFEAVIGVLYLDRGINAVRELLQPLLDTWAPRLVEAGRGPKNRLQELTRVGGGAAPAYRVVDESGPAHARHFTVEVLLGGEVMGTGAGHSKQQAEKRAAEAAIQLLLGSATRSRKPSQRMKARRPSKRAISR